MIRARSYWQKPSSTSSSAICCFLSARASQSGGNALPSLWSVSELSLFTERFSLPINQLPRDLLIFDSGISVNETAPLLLSLCIVYSYGLCHLDQPREAI